MAMTQANIDAERVAILNARQAAYEAQYVAIVANDKPGRQAAKQALGDLSDREDSLNNIQAIYSLLHPTP
jgi:hypothetical protein